MRPGTGSGAARASAVSFCLLIAAVVAAFDAFEWDPKVKELINKVLGG